MVPIGQHENRFFLILDSCGSISVLGFGIWDFEICWFCFELAVSGGGGNMAEFEIPSPRHNAAPVASLSPWPVEKENPHPSEISVETWVYSEKVIKCMIWRIQPTRVSEERRRNVVEYVQKLIKGYLGYEVFLLHLLPSLLDECFIDLIHACNLPVNYS